MDKPSTITTPNTFRDSNEVKTNREFLQPTEERMNIPATSHRSIIRAVNDDDDHSSSIHPITHKPLVRSIIRANTGDDEESSQEMNKDDNTVLEASGYDRSRLQDLSADEAFALQLQQEEYGNNSLFTPRHPFPFRIESDDEPATASAPPFIQDTDHPNFRSDEDFAAYLQQQEHMITPRYFRPAGPQFVTRQRSNPTSNENSQTDENESETVPPVFPLAFPYRQTSHTEDDSDEEHPYAGLPHPFFQFLINRGRPLPEDFPAIFTHFHGRGFPRSGNLQDTEEDFGPEDYERLLRLDETIHKKKLTKDQINCIPTEPFRRTSNNTDEENKCGICLELFDIDQTLRRFPCRHVYHKDCSDRWLQENNACPICREPPVKVQSLPNPRSHRNTNHNHNHNHHNHNHSHHTNTNTNTRRSTNNTNRNPSSRTANTRRGGSSQRPS